VGHGRDKGFGTKKIQCQRKLPDRIVGKTGWVGGVSEKAFLHARQQKREMQLKDSVGEFGDVGSWPTKRKKGGGEVLWEEKPKGGAGRVILLWEWRKKSNLIRSIVIKIQRSHARGGVWELGFHHANKSEGKTKYTHLDGLLKREVKCSGQRGPVWDGKQPGGKKGFGDKWLGSEVSSRTGATRNYKGKGGDLVDDTYYQTRKT